MGSKILDFIRNNPDNWEQNLNDRENAVADYDEYAKIRKNLFGKEDDT